MSSTTIAGKHVGQSWRRIRTIGDIMILIIRSAKESPGTTVLVALVAEARDPRKTRLLGYL
jgi:hypothetical protein